MNPKLIDKNFSVCNLDLSPEMVFLIQEKVNQGFCIAWTFGLIRDGYNALKERIKKNGYMLIEEPNNPSRYFFNYGDSYSGICDGQELQIFGKNELLDIMTLAHEILSDITIGYGNDERIEMHLFTVTKGDIDDHELQVNPSLFGQIREDLYPSIDIKILNEQFMAAAENILILYGPPGTGKTSFAKYLVSHQVVGSTKIAYAKDEKCIEHPGLWTHLQTENFNIMILDDADSLLSPRKHGMNEALSQLLSFSDGLIRNKTKIIITTNQIVQEIDDALVRPGRCFDFITLEPMSFDYAKNVWVNNLNNEEEAFNAAFKGLTEVTQASIMEQHNRLKLDMKMRNYMKIGPTQYSIQQKLTKLDINCFSKNKAGFGLNK